MYLFYVNMQKRRDGRIYPDLHKTDEKIYFTPEDAQAAIDSDPALAPQRHVVAMVAQVYDPTDPAQHPGE